MKVADALKSYRKSAVLNPEQHSGAIRRERWGGANRGKMGEKGGKAPEGDSTMPTRHTGSERETRSQNIAGVCPALGRHHNTYHTR